MIFGKHINKYYIRYLGFLLLGIAALFTVDYLQLRIPELYRMVINGVNDGVVEFGGENVPFDMNFLLEHICRPMIIIIFGMVVCRFLWRMCFFGSAILVETDIRGKMFDHCKDLPQSFYHTNKVGDLMSLFTNDLETIQDCFGSGILMFTDALVLGLLALRKMWLMNRLLTLFSLIPMVFMFIIGLTVGRYMEKKWDERQAAFSKLSDFSQESFSGVAVIKAFVSEYRELLAFRKLNKENEDANVTFVRMSMLLEVSTDLLIESVMCVIIGYGGYLAHKGVFNAGELLEFSTYFDSIIWPVIAVSELIAMTSRGKASLKRVGDLLDEPVVIEDTDKVCIPEDTVLRGDIEFRHLAFDYPGSERHVMSDMNFTIKAGENVGIIGRTGTGKTTVANLLVRTYNVPDGTILLDGRDINEYPLRTVRANIAYVPQDNFLFSDTIAANIAFCKGDVKEWMKSMEDAGDDWKEILKAVAEDSDVAGDIEGFTDQYMTVLGERGVTVSGGQKQRISIARALLKDAPILVLDDSVSAVDVSTEKKILDILRQKRSGKTTVLIGHRISTMEQMDKIIFLEDGAVTDIGSHEELVERCPAYKKMAELQKLDETSEGGDRA